MNSVCWKSCRHTAILHLKKELLARNLYSFEKYTSMDVYHAVLELGITDIDTFLTACLR